jgi:hypothetical protein
MILYVLILITASVIGYFIFKISKLISFEHKVISSLKLSGLNSAQTNFLYSKHYKDLYMLYDDNYSINEILKVLLIISNTFLTITSLIYPKLYFSKYYDEKIINSYLQKK